MLLTLSLHTWRSLSRHRAVSAAIITVLGLGMGATIALFAVANALILRPLPYPNAGQLVQIWSQQLASDLAEAHVSYPRYDTYGHARTFAAVGAFWPQDFSIRGTADSVRLPGALVSASLFTTLDLAPLHGRLFRPEEDRPGAAPVAVISAGLWRRRFGGAPDTVGSTITIDGRPATIIGIVDAPIVFARDCCELFVPRVSEPDTLPRRIVDRGAGYLTVIGRLQPNVTLETALAELRDVSRRYTADHRDNVDASFAPHLVPLADQVLGGSRGTLTLLLAAGMLVFLTAAANAGGLLLVRHLGRATEMNVQRALGAHRRHLVLPLLAESLVLALAAAAVGVVTAAGALQFARVSFANVLSPWSIRLADRNVAVVAAGLVGVACVVAALVPAVSIMLQRRSGVSAGMPTRSATPRRGEAWGLSVFAVIQLALSFALVATAVDLSRSIWRLQHADLGFRPDALLTAQVAPAASPYPDLAAQTDLYRRLRARLLQLPGVVAVGTSQMLPTLGDQRIPYRIGGRAAPPPGEQPMAQFRFVDEGYFEALGIPLRRGRGFTDAETRDSVPVAVISESVARREFAGRDPLGADIILATTPPRRIIGVAGDVRELGAAAGGEPGVYVPLAQMFIPRLPPMFLAVRAERDGLNLTESVRTAALGVDPDQPLARLRDMQSILDDGLTVPRLRAILATTFAVIGLLLAGIGIYSALSYTGARRATEYGMRLALGASPMSVATMVARSTASVVAAGLIAGTAASIALNRLAAAFVSDVGPTHGATLVITTLVLCVFAAAATVIPLRRVLRIDPVQALRNQ